MWVADDNEQFMRQALRVAREGMEAGEMPIGAVVVVDGEIVAANYTQETARQRLLVHADLLALLAADPDIRGRRSRARLYVNVEPCLMCLGAAFTARIGQVIYGLASPSDGGVGAFNYWNESRDHEAMAGYEMPGVTGGVMLSESAELMREYAARQPAGSWTARWALSLAPTNT